MRLILPYLDIGLCKIHSSFLCFGSHTQHVLSTAITAVFRMLHPVCCYMPFCSAKLRHQLINKSMHVCSTLYDVFRNIMEDESEHVDVMTACRDYSIVEALAVRRQEEGQPDESAATMDRSQLT